MILISVFDTPVMIYTCIYHGILRKSNTVYAQERVKCTFWHLYIVLLNRKVSMAFYKHQSDQ